MIDCTGLTIYPGLIDGGTQLGLIEVDSLPETRDQAELGDLTPHLQALTAVNPNAVAIPVTRVNGVTTVITEPSGGLFPGTAALINLHGYTPAQMHVGRMRVVVLDYPPAGRRGPGDERPEEEVRKAAWEAAHRLAEIWEQARRYARIDSAYRAAPDSARRPEVVLAMEALLPAVRGEVPLLIRVDWAQDILSAIDWMEARGLRNVLFSGVAEGWRVADRIAAAGIPCLVGPVLALPSRPSDRYDKAYANAGLLHRAGVKVALRSGETENARNLPYHAGFVAAYELGREAALRAVTIHAAEVLGVSHLIGSLEAGKQATLFVADGDPFEPRTQIRHLFIYGYRIPLTNRQIRLYEEFLDHTPGLVEHGEDVE